MEAIETYELASGNKLQIFADECNESPREWDNLAVMAFFHTRYDLGDKTDYNVKDYGGWGELEKAIIKNEKPILIYPVFMYDHSGISISISREYPYNDMWDSGMIGFVFIPRDKVLKEWKVKRISPKLKATLEKNIRAEIETYDQYLRGEVYGFRIIKEKHCPECGNDDNDEIDSCWGFYGHDIKKNGILDNISPDKLA